MRSIHEEWAARASRSSDYGTCSTTSSSCSSSSYDEDRLKTTIIPNPSETPSTPPTHKANFFSRQAANGANESLVEEDESTEEEEEDRAVLLERTKRQLNYAFSHPALCPHCKGVFIEPVSLMCGHSLCAGCCKELLAAERRATLTRAAGRMHLLNSNQLNTTVTSQSLNQGGSFTFGHPLRRSRVRMGVNSYSRLEDNAGPVTENKSASVVSFGGSMGRCSGLGALKHSPSTRSLFSSPVLLSQPVMLAPACPVCEIGPSTMPPIPNLGLAEVLRNCPDLLPRGLVKSNPPPLPRRHSCLSKTLKSPRHAIRDCVIGVVGAKGVGKSVLKRAQHENDLLFKDVNGCRGGDDFMLEIREATDVDKLIRSAHGFLLVYSITDRQSLFFAVDLHKKIVARRGPRVPCVLIGAKGDLERDRRVASHEGQQRARLLQLPFFEVSARLNECVNEAFADLVRLIDQSGAVPPS